VRQHLVNCALIEMLVERRKCQHHEAKWLTDEYATSFFKFAAPSPRARRK